MEEEIELEKYVPLEVGGGCPRTEPEPGSGAHVSADIRRHPLLTGEEELELAIAEGKKVEALLDQATDLDDAINWS